MFPNQSRGGLVQARAQASLRKGSAAVSLKVLTHLHQSHCGKKRSFPYRHEGRKRGESSALEGESCRRLRAQHSFPLSFPLFQSYLHACTPSKE